MIYKLITIFFSVTLLSCKDFKEISVTNVNGFKMNKINAEKIEAEIQLKINNPNNMGFSIYPSQFDVVFSGMKLGKAKLNKRVHINAKTEQVYTFQLNTNLSELNPLDALKLLNMQNLGNIEVNGDLKAGKFYLKKKFPIDYKDKVKLFQ
jgi:LEA14-like dessication related protein